MPTNDQLVDELKAAKATILRQQLFISQQRFARNRTVATRIAMVAGQHVDQVNPKAEANKVADLMATADPDFKALLETLLFYGTPSNYTAGGVPNPASSVMADRGARAREALKRLA